MISSLSSRYILEKEPEWSRSEADWLWRIPCRNGGENAHIFRIGKELLGFFGSAHPTKHRLLAAGCEIHQEGDIEFILSFHESRLDEIAKIARAKTKRVVSEKMREHLKRVGRSFQFRKKHGVQNADEEK